MTCSGTKPDLFRWKRITKNKKESLKPQLNNEDIGHWIKRVEQASEFAVSEVFSIKKPTVNRNARGHAMALKSIDQLHDHDDAYAEAQELLSDWMNSKLRLELEIDEEDGLVDRTTPEPAPSKPQTPPFLRYNKFDDLYSHLEQEVESSTAHRFLQELMEKEVMDSGILEDLRMDKDKATKRRKDPRLTMEMRHQQVKENRARRQAELEQVRKEKALKRDVQAEAQRLLQEEERRRLLEARRQEEEIQREVVRLRKEMADKKSITDQARHMERERLERRQALERAAPPLTDVTGVHLQTQREQLEAERLRKLQAETRVQIHNLRCVQKHFSGWYTLVLERRMKMGKAGALSDWRSQLRAFRAWQAYMWTRRAEREAQLTEAQLRDDNRKQQLATESDRRRVLRHCLTEWQLWCKAEREKRDLGVKKEETKRKMAALLDAASTGKLWTERSCDGGAKSQHAQNDSSAQKAVLKLKNPDSASSSTKSKPKHAWQVTKKHATLNAEELSRVREQATDLGTLVPSTGLKKKLDLHGSNFENRYDFQQHMIEEQKKQLLEQKGMILELQENQRLLMLKQEAERATAMTKALSNPGQKHALSTPSRASGDHQSGTRTIEESSSPPPLRTLGHSLPDEAKGNLSSFKGVPSHTASPHPTVKAMEERAKQRAERRREIEEMKRKREEEKLAELQAAEEERQRKEEAEKQALLEKKREEKRLQKQKELEKQKSLERQQQLQTKADEHYRKFLLKNRGLKQWKQLLEHSKHNMQLAEGHHGSSLLRRCLLSWQQIAINSLSERTASAAELYHHILLRRCLGNWLKCKNYTSILEEKAVRFYKASLVRKTFLALLNYITEEKIAMWDKQKIAAEHNQSLYFQEDCSDHLPDVAEIPQSDERRETKGGEEGEAPQESV
ncbi:coiled-coil domain-containing protein 191 isoform X2 [Polyodon spathula]|uniref:coiled-coil domain-containing protein 191 isoform X2 n=1 Tax=Polyodon spathula TaxID=7913 RepID=UPI001B7E252E|nr:coiled-coil domain-containing protein 191 isoform X2 [Polyodon spathula]